MENTVTKKGNTARNVLFGILCLVIILLSFCCYKFIRMWYSEQTVRIHMGLPMLSYAPRGPSYEKQIERHTPNIGIEPSERAFKKGSDSLLFVIKNASPCNYTYDPRHYYIVKETWLGDVITPVFAHDIGNLNKISARTPDPPAEGETAEHSFEVSLEKSPSLPRGEYTLYLEITFWYGDENNSFDGLYLLPCKFKIE